MKIGFIIIITTYKNKKIIHQMRPFRIPLLWRIGKQIQTHTDENN